MRHDWIIEVLTDLRAYAERNSLARIAQGTDDLLALARAEIASGGPVEGSDGAGGGGPGGAPPRGVPH
jgi:hypothetical protein